MKLGGCVIFVVVIVVVREEEEEEEEEEDEEEEEEEELEEEEGVGVVERALVLRSEPRLTPSTNDTGVGSALAFCT